MMSWASVEGLPLPLGATWAADDRAYNFAIYAWHAGQVTLLLYGDDLRTPVLTYRFDAGRNKSGHVWHCRIPVTAAPGARYYAYSIDGPRSAPHQFDPDKILFDPYARAIFFPPEFDRRPRVGPGRTPGARPSACSSPAPRSATSIGVTTGALTTRRTRSCTSST